jgi:V/A-type H+-transporting ATPase subunit B
MGFRMSDWDQKLLKYGERFENEMMDLSVNIPLEGALDLGWTILADCFESMETGIQSSLIEAFWPVSASQSEATPGKPSPAEAEEDSEAEVPAEAEETEAQPEPEAVEA